ncbi:MAG: tRNA (adenosine(37)-N6)-dimethylallyltransferase MiaA, partial [Phycisphaeraceae bacterium]|nr:tRNA (adenosine(37)-N6)-dimethylallyltransferase MiaA [Phycisphaeraceae bacterium]
MGLRDQNLIVVLGPTATGKTRFAALLAHAVGGEIISADSRQVYRQMNLGTGKDYEDYVVEGHTIASHLIDICDPGQKYHVHAFQKDFYAAFEAIHGRGHLPILCGGTGMYIEAVTRGYSLPAVERNEALRAQLNDKTLVELQSILSGYKTLHNRSDTDTRERALRAIEIQTYCERYPLEENQGPEIKPFFLGMQLERALCRQRIATRLHQRFKVGMVEEVQGLLDQGIKPEDLIYYGLEYKFITQHLCGEMDYKTLVEKLYIAICQFSKRQMTWFRRMERKGTKIHWIDALQEDDAKVKHAIQMMNSPESTVQS